MVTGHRGMVGSALMRILAEEGYHNLHTVPRPQVDLRSQSAVNDFFAHAKPDHVFLAAAKVGGIYANNEYPAEFIYDNLMIATNVIRAAYGNKARSLLFFGSSCIYPKITKQPMTEDLLLTGALEPTNEPYALAKIAGIKLCESYNRQYRTDFRCIMPTNVYGDGDNFHLEDSHVVAAMIHRFHLAKEAKQSKVTLWGTGMPRRELIHVEDVARAAIFVMNVPRTALRVSPSHINVGVGEDIAIRELAEVVQNVVGYTGTVEWDNSKPDGTPRKLLDISQLRGLGWQPQIDLATGLQRTYEWFSEHYLNLRK